MTLDEYLQDQARRRFVWGVSDCVAFGLRWARERTGRDLTAFFPYASRERAASELAARGGLERVVRAWMAENNFAPTDDPDDGDLGLAPVPAGGEIVAPVAIVIRRGPWWITREPRGIGGTQFDEKIPAWRIA